MRSAALLLAAVAAAAGGAIADDEAFYVCASAAEHQSPPVSAVYIADRCTEQIDGQAYHWWELTALTREGDRFGLRVLSRYVPLTCADAPGRILRYIYLTPAGTCFDYRNAADDSALLPQIGGFTDVFLPRTCTYTRYERGFATVGTFLGHVLVRTWYTDLVEPLDFPRAKVLRLTPDLLIGTARESRSDYAPPKDDGSLPEARPYTREDVRTMIEAGMNYFGPSAERFPDIRDEAVFFRGMPTYPYTFYRSNWVPGRMFIDEPMTRLGTHGRIPFTPLWPEQVAQNIFMDVQSHYEPRVIATTNYRQSGAYFPMEPKSPAWETQYWSAWYQLAAGAPGFIHEGRYSRRGYGWEPEQLFGEGTDGLSDMDMYNCFNAFLRGAARAFDAYWGVSVYPEGDADLRLPAIIRAYDMGARCIWIWNDPAFPYLEQVKLLRGLKEHIREHPRGDMDELLHKATVGIAFPRGYSFSWWGTWGADRERLSPAGASYGDISAAGMWEGILCSRSGIEFDFLQDEPRIYDMGYERLVVVHEDGSVTVDPPWMQSRAPKGLSLELTERGGATIASRMDVQPDILVPRAAGITIDGDLSDWSDANWTHLTRDKNGFADSYELELTLTNVSSEEEVKANERYYMGFEYGDLTDEAMERYRLEVPRRGEGTLVTKVYPGSPAATAGLREGDVIYHVAGRRTRWPFEMYRELNRLKTAYGAKIALDVRRSGWDRFRREGDCDALFALAVDDEKLYFAAEVNDDVHRQRHSGWELWMGDSIQLGFAPTLEKHDGSYGEQDHEIGFVLKDGAPIAWRWKGRRGQPVGRMRDVELVVVRKGDRTIYEAAVPLRELAPLSPDLWPRCGFDIVINDSDGQKERKGRLELRPKAMTDGKHTARFAVLGFAPSPDERKVSAAIMWSKRCAQTPGAFELIVAARSPQERTASIAASLVSLDEPSAIPLHLRTPLDVSEQATEWVLRAGTESPPGRYKLKVTVSDAAGKVAATDELPVYVYK